MTPLPTWALICFLASGAAGLLYEIAWSKQLAFLLGASLHAVATVVAAFLAGLALGARFLGVPLARKGDGARMYAKLEVGIALLGLLSLPLLRGLDPLVGMFYRSLGGETAMFGVARVALLFVLLLPPAAMMGATLPVLVAHFESRRVGAGLARLYAVNTVGAVFGSAAAGFLLLPAVGLLATTWIAAALNLVAAALAWRAGGSRARVEPAAAPPDTAPRTAPADALEGPAWLAFTILFAGSGFAALFFQIAWVRLFGLVFGSSVYSFSAVLGVYLTGLAIGSWGVARFMAGATLATFGRLQILLAAVCALELHVFSRLPEAMFEIARATGSSWSARLAWEGLLAAGMLLVPCAMLGAAFPIATRLLQRGDGGHAAGFAYAVNTAGTIAGSLLAGFWAVPTFGVQGTHLAATLLSGAIGIAAIAIGGAGRPAARDLAVALAGVVAVVGLAFTAPRWDPALMSMGAFRPTQAGRIATSAAQETGPGGVVARAASVERVLFYREGINGSVYVATDTEGRERWIRVGGKTDASTSDMETQILVGLIPALLADSGARALVIGHGSGATTAAVLAGGAGPTEMSELEPAVVEASRLFHAPGEDPLDDPRLTVFLGDARTRLTHGEGRYDLIVSQPSNPWIAGNNNLFTVDFYRKVKARLAEGGVFGQWMQLYEIAPETFRTLVASFLEVFPEAQVFAVWRSVDVLLIVAPPERRLAIERLGTPAGRRMLERARIASPEALAAFYGGPLAALEGGVNGVPLNRDDRPIVEYQAPKDLIAVGTGAINQGVVGAVPFAVAPPPGRWFEAWPGERWDEGRVRGLLAGGDLERAALAIANARTSGHAALADRLTAELEAGSRRRQSEALVEQALAHIRSGQVDEARAALARATETDPANHRAWLIYADRLRVAGDLDAAGAAIARGSEGAPPDLRADAANLRGMLELARQSNAAAIPHFLEAQELAPAVARSYLLEAQAWLADGNAENARAALRRGLEKNPGHEQMTSALERVGR